MWILGIKLEIAVCKENPLILVLSLQFLPSVLEGRETLDQGQSQKKASLGTSVFDQYRDLEVMH